MHFFVFVCMYMKKDSSYTFLLSKYGSDEPLGHLTVNFSVIPNQLPRLPGSALHYFPIHSVTSDLLLKLMSEE